jgi:hypothetical protein
LKQTYCGIHTGNEVAVSDSSYAFDQKPYIMKLTDHFSKQKKEIADVTQVSNTGVTSPSSIICIVIGIILLIVLANVGFYKTYFSHFPGFEDYVRPDGRQLHFTWIMHFHGMMMIGWLLMLLVQPLLILKGKVELHRLVGRLSYVLAPLVLLTMYLVTRAALDRVVAPEEQAVVVARRMALDVPLIIFFAIVYILAIVYKHRTSLHSRFMVSTAFMLIGPPLSRLLRAYFDYDREGSIDLSRTIIVFIALTVTIGDSLRLKSISPFALVLVFVLLNKIIWGIRDTAFWQPIGSAIGKLF